MNNLSASTTPSGPAAPARFAFISSCLVEWGGSEELWAATALHLARAGHDVRAFKTTVNPRQLPLLALRAAGCPITELAPPLPWAAACSTGFYPTARATKPVSRFCGGTCAPSSPTSC